MFEKTLKKLAASLTKAKVPYMVIGGQAVLVYGEPRFTRDIDVTLGIGTEDINEILAVCKKARLIPIEKDIKSFVSETMVLPAKDSATGIRVDFIFSFTPYEAKAIKRARKLKFGRQPVNFASPEDVIIHKIFSGRPRDLEDVHGILLRGRRLDKNYIVRWLKEFDQTFLGKNFLFSFQALSSNVAYLP